MKNLSPQQKSAVSAVSDTNLNIILSAVAGAGKTSTLISMLKATTGSVAFCAFNKAISSEIATKIEPMGLENVKVGTLHSFGFGAIRRAISRVKVDGNKLRKLAVDNFNGEYENLRPFVISATSMAKEVGIGAVIEDNYDNWLNMLENYGIWDLLPSTYNDENGIDAARYLLKESNNLKGIVDFSDMIYMPVRNKMKIWQYDYVLLDEAQDTNAPRRALVRMMIKPNKGRLIAVGDAHQAIYGFTGANSDSLDVIKKEFEAIELPLSVTFRCPKAIVNVASKWVDHIEAHESAPEGLVDTCEMSDIVKLATKDDAIICRLTRPLVEMAYSLIRQNVPCKVEGRSIGEGLIKLAERFSSQTVGELDNKLSKWADKEINKYKEKGNDSRCQIIEDQVKTLEVFISECDDSDSIATLTSRIRGLFGDTKDGEILTLSTIHKSKGREWNRVFALGMATYSPSKWAKQSWEIEQEYNLCYVQVTRAKQHLTMVNVPANVA